MDTAQWPQEIVVKPIQDIVANTNTNTCAKGGGVERKARPQKDEALNCPRCHSTNTKFCYYNNYSLTQPRYFCKTCRRYWTHGGSLRNIPVGGGSRKNKRSSSSNSCSKKLPPEDPSLSHIVNSSHTHNSKILEGQDLNLGFPEFGNMCDPLVQVNEKTNNNNMSASSSTSTSCHLSALELLTGITSSSKDLNSSFTPIMPIHQDPNTVFPLQDFKPTLHFSLHESAATPYPTLHNLQHTGSGSLSFQDLKQVSPTTSSAQNSTSTGYWTAMLGASGGSNW